MAGTRQQVNKAHKSRFSSKSSRNVHKVSLQGLLAMDFFVNFGLLDPCLSDAKFSLRFCSLR